MKRRQNIAFAAGLILALIVFAALGVAGCIGFCIGLLFIVGAANFIRDDT